MNKRRTNPESFRGPEMAAEWKPERVQGALIRKIFLQERDRSKLKEFYAVLPESLLFAVIGAICIMIVD